MINMLITIACCGVALSSLLKLALALDALGGFPISPRRYLEMYGPPPSERWMTLDQPLRIDLSNFHSEPPEREPERWSDIRPSRSGPFTLEKRR